MADVTPLIAPGQQVIQSYGPDGFRVSGRAYGGAVIVSPMVTHDWTATSIAALTEADFTPLTGDDRPDVILLGCGARMALPPAVLKAALRREGIALEPMDTGAACRTYNVLMAEGRRVAAAMLPVR